jgi:hypothetical protein
VKVHAPGVVQDTKGCRKLWLTSARSSAPATDQMWLASQPTVLGPCRRRTTPVGPILHLPVPGRSSVAVGSRNTGPRPR